MVRKRTHVVLPEALLADIDKLVGQRGRSAFFEEVLQKEVRRRLLLEILNGPPIWKIEDHPELADGSEAWVRKLREESDQRLNREPDEIL